MDLMHVDRERRGLVERTAFVTLWALGEPVIFGVPPDHARALLTDAGLEPLQVLTPTELCPDGHPGMYVALAQVPERPCN